MVRRLRVTVDGQVYEVELEEVTAAEPAPPPRREEPTPTAAVEVKEAAPAPTRRAASRPKDGGATIKAPLPGMVLDVKVAPGARVEEGQVLVILEAMKMENEIVAPHDGTVEQVAVEKGTAVSEGDTLVVLS